MEYKEPEPIRIDISDEVIIPKHYIVGKTMTELKIDGIANESEWAKSTFTDLFIDIEGSIKPKYDTKVKMLWDDDYLYLYAELEEEHIWGDLRERDAIIYYNNDFEIFIDPSGDTQNYGEIEINALGTIFDLMLNRPYKTGGHAIISWNIEGLKSAVHIDGTLNDASDIDSKWTVEMAIPLKAFVDLNRPKKAPVDGDLWRINFSRVNWEFDLIDGKYSRKKVDGKYLHEYNWVWSPQYVINMHEPEKWGYLQFSDHSNSENVEMIKDTYLFDKQVMYALFRLSKSNKIESLKNHQAGIERVVEAKIGNSSYIYAFYQKTYKGFEFTYTSHFTQTKYIIDEEGLLKIISK